MKNIANTKKGSKHWRALGVLKVNKSLWISSRRIEDFCGQWNISLSRRLREDVNKGILKVRHTNGYAEYKWRKDIK